MDIMAEIIIKKFTFHQKTHTSRRTILHRKTNSITIREKQS
jgi:hypothetical protein